MRQLKIVIILCFLTSSLVFSQNVQRSSLGSSGDTKEVVIKNKHYYISQSVGQSSVIGTFTNGSKTIRQGFQQPLIKVEYISSLDNHLNASVYPNPVSTYVTILFNETLKTSTDILIYDTTGKLVYNKSQEPTDSFKVDMSYLASGVYLLNLTSGNKKFIARLIKN
jgi:hypothetical protein